LLDKTLLDDPMAKLKSKYPYAAWVDYLSNDVVSPDMHIIDVEHVSKEKLFRDFYEAQNGQALSESQSEIIHSLLTEEKEDH
jgi:hypothetical protein